MCVHHSMLFSFRWINTTVELTIAVSSQFKFFLLARDTVSFPTDEHFSPDDRWFSLNSGCQDVVVPPPIRVRGVRFLLFLSFAGFCTFVCGSLVGILYLHTRNTLLHHFTLFVFVSSLLSHRPSFCIYNRNSRFRFYFWSFFLTQKSSIWITLQTREKGEWLDWSTLLCALDSPTFTVSMFWCSTCFYHLHDLMSCA